MKIYVGIYTNSSSMIIIDWITDEKTFIKKRKKKQGRGRKEGCAAGYNFNITDRFTDKNQ